MNAISQSQQQTAVFTIVLNTLPNVQLCQHGYALNEKGESVGLHSADAIAFDLASLIWQACELQTYIKGRDTDSQQQALFRECWFALRAHFNWDSRKHSTDTALCKWLDAHTSKGWYLDVIQQVLNGESYTPRKNTAPDAKATAAKQAVEKGLEEYV